MKTTRASSPIEKLALGLRDHGRLAREDLSGFNRFNFDTV